MSVNKVILLGNLGQDPELVESKDGGAPLLKFHMATEVRWKGSDGEKKEHTTWHWVNIWGKEALKLYEILHKGSKVYVEGRIDNQRYSDPDGGKDRFRTIVRARDVQLV